MKAKITKRSVEAIEPAAKDQFLWDSELPGFGCKVTPKGARVYVFQYWAGQGAKRVTLGRHGVDLTAEEARKEAQRLRGAVAGGGDPAADKSAAERARGITFAELSDRYLSDHADTRKKAASIAADRRNLRLHILPGLGGKDIREITRGDVAALHASLRDKPIVANRCLALLSKMFNLAEAWELRPDGTNPAKRVEKYPERRHERFLSDVELARLGQVLAEAADAGEHPSVIAALRLLILTGCRRDEVLTLQWAHVDLERGCLRLPDSKTGAKVVPLGGAAVALLSELPRVEGNPYVLPGDLPGKHYVALEKAWRRLRLRAGLADLRLHDLRHSFASVGAGLGESLRIIGALLGHRQMATTERYAHLADNPARAAADRISGEIAAALGLRG